ncbi:sentrin sumo-specific [Colletotrichum asianum]|uniref:Sentrin sumo-specific n=1 Tax=Colletotrichum asianum TaxID=702518 RepID=A0A8H3ZM64_9PEZI|nr:sentrin sumo-specific [Colletotrichum asianum]
MADNSALYPVNTFENASEPLVDTSITASTAMRRDHFNDSSVHHDFNESDNYLIPTEGDSISWSEEDGWGTAEIQGILERNNIHYAEASTAEMENPGFFAEEQAYGLREDEAFYLEDEDVCLDHVDHNRQHAVEPLHLDLEGSDCSDLGAAQDKLPQQRYWQFEEAIFQLQGPRERLTGDTIELMQELIVDSALHRSEAANNALLMHPLWLKIDGDLPSRLPRAAFKARRVFAVIHHDSPLHWTLGEIDLAAHTFRHYDPMGDAEMIYKICQRVLNWLEDLTGDTFMMEDLTGPRQPDATSCGVYVLDALSYLIEENPLPEEADMMHLRQKLLQLATEGFDEDFPGETVNSHEDQLNDPAVSITYVELLSDDDGREDPGASLDLVWDTQTRPLKRAIDETDANDMHRDDNHCTCSQCTKRARIDE